MPEDCTAYIATEIASPSVLLKPIARAGEYVPYGTPVLVQGPAKTTITLKAENKDSARAFMDADASDRVNLLVGTYPGRTIATGEGYCLKATGENIYRTMSSVALPPFSCYMPSAEKRTYFKLEEDATRINASEASGQNQGRASSAVYDLAGRRIKSSGQPGRQPEGIYIRDGKKVVVR